MKCPYCKAPVLLKDNKIIYGKSYGKSYICSNYPKCNSYVGCHPGTTQALGTLADAKLRGLRNLVHELFDPIWQTKQKTRRKAYHWLAEVLDIPFSKTHIAMFDVNTCQKAIKILNALEVNKGG